MTQQVQAVPQQAAPLGETPKPAAAKRRDPFFDNAKYLAILLVAAGHTIVGLRHKVPAAEALYLYVYMFHMPLFIVITGYFSRNFTFGGNKARKLITNLGVPYVVFEVLYSLMEWRITDNDLRISLLDPIYLTWFMLALFAWRLSTPVWQQVRWPLAVAVVIALISYTGPMSGQLDMHRIFGLAPFYVLGLCLKKEHFEYLRRRWVRIAGAVVLVLGYVAAFYAKDHMNYIWVYWRDSNKGMGVSNLEGTAMRLGMMIVATLLVAAFLAVVPRRHLWFTALGSTTIYAYLLHGFLVKYLQYREWDHVDWLQSIPGMLLMIAASVAVATFLCSKPVVRALHWAVEPDMRWAFTRLRKPAKKAPVTGTTEVTAPHRGHEPDLTTSRTL
ncbi:acyltransferase family protein [Actinocorallia lasiicapitis]